MFSEEGSEEQCSPQKPVQVLGSGSSVGRKFLQTVLGAADGASAAVRLEGTSCRR